MRLICALQAAEQNVIIADDPRLTSKDIRNMNLKLKNKGVVGCVEATCGTPFHHYEPDDDGILTKVNLTTVFGIEIGDEVAFGESFSSPLSEKLPAIIEQIITYIAYPCFQSH